MDVEGAHGYGYRESTPASSPAVPPPAPPPKPSYAPGAPPPPGPGHVPGQALGAAHEDRAAPFLTWLRTPRVAGAPGTYAYGHVPRPAQEPERLPDRRLVGGAVGALVCGAVVWSLFWDGYLPFLIWPLEWVTPDSWLGTGSAEALGYSYYVLLALVIAVLCGRAGRWPEAVRRYLLPLLRRTARAASAAKAARSAGTAADPAATGADDPAGWPELRAAGEHATADRLADETLRGALNDVDFVRLHRAWARLRTRPDGTAAYARAVAEHGAAAFAHPSGARDLPVRTARHDLYTAQVRLGAADDGKRNPYAYRGVGFALDPALLGTSLLVVGPPGAGKTRHVVRPVVESLCLQALAGGAAVVAVGAAGSALGPDDAFDVVIRLGDPASGYDLDLYGGTADPDEAAGLLAEALLDGFDGPEADPRRAATALARVLGPYRAAHGRFPAVPELRELLDGNQPALATLRDALEAAQEHAWARELAAWERQSGRPGDIGALLADRVALLDRPAFAGFFDVSGKTRPFALSALEHPVRVRIDLPQRGHAEASRMLARLLLAQFTAAATARRDRSVFACLVLDDAARAVTAEAVRGLQRLRSAHAGVVLALRTLDDVPETLRSALLGATGCRMALSGVTTWDGKRFAESWGTTWVEESDVTRAPDVSGGIVRRTARGARRLFTGEAATTESVTVRKVERERWSASDLAHAVPPGHAVASLTTVGGDHSPPVLVDLRG
ncbi:MULTISPECIES: type IV secretory system conjugative DNA transfer family protein [Streptomycetaceae]|uniref:ATP/GTP binding protein n=1 Tax=Streptantibioticus cattleyicolor (strain ATCC 35852 / DSM 46488 / JCM 4925 / NBRC 14057 / NRRL 8057) TaxID=1003195 RepID=F8JTR9_STREN|nr:MULTISPECIES: hypothetical protein [Streptomycetaceae]AEW96839.1 ATP/GTP binding protein [Streptantibioticus cattleyicolor NRRL 8057 = DSM 46488]MYS61320.1 ATP-binding protein [Streptomyces sp. SID5468]CCB77169.1 putative ATP/GTP binding protein [Streptantibioticus cattleyicolor NRRL 8057 = DSM 46488]